MEVGADLVSRARAFAGIVYVSWRGLVRPVTGYHSLL